MTTETTSERFTALPDEETLAATVIALEEHGSSVEVVDDLDAARDAVLARIPEGSSVMTNTSVTLEMTGTAAAIDGGGPYESARNASYAWGAANVIFVVGAQKLVPDLDAARRRIVEHSLRLEDARAYAAYGQNSFVGKVLEIHQELPGRIQVILIRQPVGF